jgi:hypothetical protein
MHLGILSGLIVALTGSFWGGASAHTTGPVYQTNLHSPAALYSIMAQTATTPTIAVTGTVQAASTITATGVATGSGTITATATLTNTTPTVPPPTPVPLPSTTTSSGGMQINPLDWNFLTSYPISGILFDKLGPFAIIYLVLMLVLIGAGIYLYRVRAPQWKSTNPVLFKAVNRFTPYALWIAVLGIIFLICRVVPIDALNLRYWLYLDFVALIALAIWILYWYRDSYPKEIAKFQKTQKARQYMPGGSGRVPSRSTAVATPPAKGSQQPKAGTAPKPTQQGNRNRKKK